ncbi:MAG: DNA methyltransferase [Thermodesulfobacteriota bacterium]
MRLSDRDKQLIKGYIDRGEPLPPRYRLTLFPDAPEVELVWQGKSTEVTNVVLPFRSLERVNTADHEAPNSQDSRPGLSRKEEATHWTNKLIWGDNKLVVSSLKNGPMREEIEAAGGLKLIYIDPPFHLGTDFSIGIQIGEDGLSKHPVMIDELAYRDTWGRGPDAYLSMMYERLMIMSDLLSEDGSIWVHCDWKVNFLMRAVMDEVFGAGAFRNEIIWYYTNKIPDTRKRQYTNSTDTILYYTRSDDHIFHWQYDKRDKPIKVSRMKKVNGKKIYVKDEQGRGLYVVREDRTADNVWRFPLLHAQPEILGYPTQKPEQLLQRIILTASNPGDLIADFFCGSGTTLAVAQRLGRKWIGCDAGRLAVHTSRKRLNSVCRELKAKEQPCADFEILSTGPYERRHWMGLGPNISADRTNAHKSRQDSRYVDLVLSAYKVDGVASIPLFHGKKGAAAVLIGPLDVPVSREMLQDTIAAASAHGIHEVDVLGFEFETDLKPVVHELAREQGVDVCLKHIPSDIFDARAVVRDQVQFYPVGYVEAQVKVTGNSVSVTLTDYGIFHRQEDPEALANKLKGGTSLLTVDRGLLVRVAKDKKGKISLEVLTKKWADWIDYWAVDFEYGSHPVFESHWQSFRTRKARGLDLTSSEHAYEAPGCYKIAVKVIDIFGNETSSLVEVAVDD